MAKKRSSKSAAGKGGGQGASEGPALDKAPERWLQFVQWTSEIQDGLLYFRGHQDHQHTLDMKPRIGRGAIGRYSRDLEKRIFEDFRRRAARFQPDHTFQDWDWLVLAQHFDLPTRLLDWTSNPFVAAFFAVTPTEIERETGAPPQRTAEIVGVGFHDTHRLPPNAMGPDSNWQAEEPGHVKWFEPSVRAARVLTQKSVFTWHPKPATPLSLEDGMNHGPFNREIMEPHRTKWTFKIEPSCFPHFRRRLRHMGIDEEFIRQDLIGVSRSIVHRNFGEPQG